LQIKNLLEFIKAIFRMMCGSVRPSLIIFLLKSESSSTHQCRTI